MAIDFKKLVNQRPATRPVADLREARNIKTDLWLNFNPTTASSPMKSALTKVKNAPVSTSFWESVKQSAYDALMHPVTQGVLNTLDAPKNALFTQIDAWTDGELTWEDALGGLMKGAVGSYTGDKVDMSHFFERMGWENQEGWQSGWSAAALADNLRDILAFAGDVALDPTTYLTIGAGSAIKHSAKAAQQALEAGLKQGTREFDEFVEKAARAEANNQLLGINIPFGQEITLAKKFGPFKMTTQTIGAKPAADLARRMADLGLTDEQRYRFASQVFGRNIKSFKDLNTQEFDYLNNALNGDLADKLRQWAQTGDDPFASPFVRASDNVEVLGPNQLPSGSSGLPAVRNLWDEVAAAGGTRLAGQSVVHGGRSSLADDIRNIVEGEFTDINPTDLALEELARTLGKGYRFVDGADGVSQIGKLLKGNKVAESIGKYLGGKRYVPLRRQLEDHRIKQAVDIMQDSRLSGFARARAAVDDMAKLVKEPEIKALTQEEMELIPYFIEGKFPSSFDPSSISPDRMEVIQKAVDKFKEYRDKFTQAEKAAGVEYTVRDNYFPHILNMPEEGTKEFDAWIAKLQAVDPDLARRIVNAPRGFTRQRKLFQSMAELRDYLDANPAAKDVFGNAVFNPAEALARRAMAGAREVAKYESYQKLKELGVAQRIAPGQKPPQGWEQVDVPGLEGYFVPKEIVQKIDDLGQILTNDVAMNSFLKKANKAYTIWRRNATVLGLGFHVRQSIGNIFQNTLAGVTPDAYNDAVKALLGKPVKINGREVPAEELLRMAREDGVLGTGSSADFLEDLTRELGARVNKGNLFNRYVNVFSEQFVPGRIGRDVGEMSDNFARLAHYIWVLNKGGSRGMARESVRKYLYDYSNLTNFERGVMRTVFPFYNWMRHNLPFQIAQAAKRPGMYQVLDDLQESLSQDPAVDPLLEEAGIYGEDAEVMKQIVEENGGVLPEHIRERYVKVGDNDYFNMGLPFADLYNLDQPGEMLSQSLNPGVQWASGMMTNRNVFGAPIDKYSDQLSLFSPEGLRFTLEQFGGAPGRVAGYFLPDSAGVSRSEDKSWMEDLGRLLGVTQVDPAQQLESLLYEKAREADAAKKREKARNKGQ